MDTSGETRRHWRDYIFQLAWAYVTRKWGNVKRNLNICRSVRLGRIISRNCPKLSFSFASVLLACTPSFPIPSYPVLLSPFPSSWQKRLIKCRYCIVSHMVSFGGGYHDIYDLHLAALNQRHHGVFPRALLKTNYLMRLRLDNYYAKWLICPY